MAGETIIQYIAEHIQLLSLSITNFYLGIYLNINECCSKYQDNRAFSLKVLEPIVYVEVSGPGFI